MTYIVQIYHIKRGKMRERKFNTKHEADKYASDLKKAYLERRQPGLVFIDVVHV